VLSGRCHSATTRSLSSAWRSCEQEFACRRLLAAFQGLSSSVLRSCNHEFAFRHHLAFRNHVAFQPQVHFLPSSSSVLRQTRSRVLPSLAAFQTASSHLWAAFQGDYFAVQWFIWIQKHSTALNKIIRYKISNGVDRLDPTDDNDNWQTRSNRSER